MKKLVLGLLAVIFSVAVILPMAYAYAADVPDFRRVAGNVVRDGERVNSKINSVYAYECAVNQYDYFGDQYVSLLRQSGLSYMGHDAKDFTRTSSAMYIDKWYFSCRGQRVEFWRVKYYGEGRTSFSVRVANGLTYEGY